jgi:hypothetical protein
LFLARARGFVPNARGFVLRVRKPLLYILFLNLHDPCADMPI